MHELQREWHPASWRTRKVLQQVNYNDPLHLEAVLAELARYPPLVTFREIESLRLQLAEAATGQRFLLQGGDCAERFEDCRDDIIKNRLKILLQMSVVLIYGMQSPVVRVGRFAGQFAKPRSAPQETRGDVSLPSYRGDIINALEYSPEARTADPQRLIRAYQCAAIQLNFVRALSDGGFANLRNVDYWNLNFAEYSPFFSEYQMIIEKVRDALHFAETVSGGPISGLSRVDFYTSHEALHLPYEEALTRCPPHGRGMYNLSTHFPWIGKRTLCADSAHVEYMRGIRNPVGVKVGPGLTPSDLVSLTRHLNPNNELGRITLITRYGANLVEKQLPVMIDAVQRAGLQVLWCCDPMHGNTERAESGIKTRRFDNILEELELAFDIHAQSASVLGGVHFELTGEDVTECIGGASGIDEADLGKAYHTSVDPRLNAEQSLEMALRIVRKHQQMVLT